MHHMVTALLLLCATRGEAAELIPKIDFGAFLDTYYAFDTNQPSSRDRALSTVPSRHNEFAVNLAYLEAKVTADRLRGRVALQTGTSVLANYAGESRDSAKTGVQLADALMFLQEAYAGYRLSEGVWINAGIFFSHIGSEGFISRDNWTYTRSLVADFSPYYQAGVRATYELGPRWAVQLHVLNGWQNVVETNGDKSIGTQVTFRPSEKLTIVHNSLVGRESEFRIFQDLYATYSVLPFWKAGLTLDFGLQRRPGGGGYASWGGVSFQNRFQIAEATSATARVELYDDPQGIIVPPSLNAWGVSVNLDRQLLPQLLWRTEARYLRATDAVFPSGSGKMRSTLFGVTSLALSL